VILDTFPNVAGVWCRIVRVNTEVAEIPVSSKVCYVTLAVPSVHEARRLVEDLTENPGQPLHTPRWANAVHATVVSQWPADDAVEDIRIARAG
jgi:hypothetical protein